MSPFLPFSVYIKNGCAIGSSIWRPRKVMLWRILGLMCFGAHFRADFLGYLGDCGHLSDKLWSAKKFTSKSRIATRDFYLTLGNSFTRRSSMNATQLLIYARPNQGRIFNFCSHFQELKEFIEDRFLIIFSNFYLYALIYYFNESKFFVALWNFCRWKPIMQYNLLK